SNRFRKRRTDELWLAYRAAISDAARTADSRISLRSSASNPTEYSRRQLPQRYLPWMGHITFECMFVHQSSSIRFMKSRIFPLLFLRDQLRDARVGIHNVVDRFLRPQERINRPQVIGFELAEFEPGHERKILRPYFRRTLLGVLEVAVELIEE